jgi:protein-S-isoprenylcysteine O-methyltransferase Ste14
MPLDLFDYFQIASVTIFMLVVITKIFYLLRRRHINPIAIGRGKKGLQLIVELFGFAGLVAWLVEIVLYATHSRFHIFGSPLDTQLIDSDTFRWIGVVLITIGLFIFVFAFVSFGDSWRIGVDVKKPGQLVTTGIFAFSRNPIYVFLDLWFIGVFLINGTLIFLIYAALTLPVIHWQIFQEEKFLLGLFGQSYRDYFSRTGRYFTFRR